MYDLIFNLEGKLESKQNSKFVQILDYTMVCIIRLGGFITLYMGAWYILYI